jgi:hypothetical protein
MLLSLRQLMAGHITLIHTGTIPMRMCMNRPAYDCTLSACQSSEGSAVPPPAALPII